MRRWTVAFAAAALFCSGSSAFAQEAIDEGPDEWAHPPVPATADVTTDDLLNDDAIPPTAEEELRSPSKHPVEIAGDLRLEGLHFRGGDALGVRILVEGEHFGFDGGFSGVFVQVPTGGALVANGILDLQLTFAPLSGSLGRIRLEAGIGAVFTPWVRAVGPDFGASGELSLLGPIGVAGAVRTVVWPYRSLDWNAAVQLSFGELQLRMGIRQLWVELEGLAGGQRQSFTGPWVGVGLRLPQ
ncbi:MAG: hypothetical protein QM765_26265 [Myxococcales bacterium]